MTRSTFLVLPLIALALAVLIGLGVWQLRRNDWKQEIVAERAARTAAVPIPASSVFGAPPEDVDYRRVVAIGEWDHEHSVILANRARFGLRGEEVVTPLVFPDGRAVLVDRGWYPEADRLAVLAMLEASPAAEAVGLARYVGDVGGRRTEAGTWTRLDTGAIGATLPYEVARWYVVEGELTEAGAGRGTALLVQGFTAYTSNTPHMQYALTWFGLAAALLVISVVRLVVVPRAAWRDVEDGPAV